MSTQLIRQFLWRVKEKFACVPNANFHADLAEKVSEIAKKYEREAKQSYQSMKFTNILVLRMFETKFYIKMKSMVEKSQAPTEIMWQDRFKQENTIFYNDALVNLLDFDVHSLSKLWEESPYVR